MRCTRCGNEIRYGTCYVCAQIRRNQRRYGKRPAPHYVRPEQEPLPDKPKATPYPPPPATHVRVRDLSATRQGMNRFLCRLFGRDYLLSEILTDAGMSGQQVLEVRSRLYLYYNSLAKYWCGWLHAVLLPKQYNVLVRLYALDGTVACSPAEFSQTLNTAEQNIIEIERSAFVRIQAHDGRRVFARLVCDLARHVSD